MKDSVEVLIGLGGGDHISIRVAGGRREWRGAEVEVQCDGWTGQMRWEFMNGELRRFGKEVEALRRKLSGAATLSPLEPNIKLSLAGDGKGHVTVKGTARNDFGSDTRLDFAFQIDQTFLAGIAQALSDADPAL